MSPESAFTAVKSACAQLMKDLQHTSDLMQSLRHIHQVSQSGLATVVHNMLFEL